MLNKYKRFLLIFSIIVLIFSTPIYAFVRVMLPDILLERIRSELPQGYTLKIDNVVSKINMAILYKDVELIGEETQIEIPLLEIKPVFSLKKPVLFLAEKFSFQNNSSSISASQVEVFVNLSGIAWNQVTIEGRFNNIGSPEEAILSQGEFIIAGLNSESQDIDMKVKKAKLVVRTPQGPLYFDISNGRASINKTKNLRGRLAAQKVKIEFVSSNETNLRQVVSGEEMVFDVSLEKPNDDGSWMLPVKLLSNNMVTKRGSNLGHLSLEAQGHWTGNSISDCQLSDLFSGKSGCGKMTDVLKVDIKLEDEDKFLRFFGDGFCVAPMSGCRQIIISKLESAGTQEMFLRLIESELLNPVIVSVLMGMLLGSPTDNPTAEHSINVNVDGSTILVNDQALF